jgi:hypothetical protein
MAQQGKCLIFREAALDGRTELTLAGSPSGSERRVRLARLTVKPPFCCVVLLRTEIGLHRKEFIS